MYFLPVSTIQSDRLFQRKKLLILLLCDTRGFKGEFSQDAQEISFILDGNIPDRYQVYHIFLSEHKSFYILVLF